MELTLALSSGEQISLPVAQILRVWQPNGMHPWDKLAHFAGSIWRFLSEEPREANTEGGVFPAIFGTVLMVLLMSVLVTPLGVIAAVYLMEYADQGHTVRIIRIGVNNLAGVPSIVYGVFGSASSCTSSAVIWTACFSRAALPAATFGTPGIFWASLTLRCSRCLS